MKLENCPHGVASGCMQSSTARRSAGPSGRVSVDARIAKLRDLLFGRAECADFHFAEGRIELEKAADRAVGAATTTAR